MAVEQNIQAVRTWVDQVWNKGDYSQAKDVMLPTYKFNDPAAPGLPAGPEAFTGFVSAYRTAMPDLSLSVEDIVADGDKVVWRWHAKGTHNGPLMSIPATGKHIELGGIVISRFENGKWAEDYSQWDFLGLLQQVGAVPALNG